MQSKFSFSAVNSNLTTTKHQLNMNQCIVISPENNSGLTTPEMAPGYPLQAKVLHHRAFNPCSPEIIRSPVPNLKAKVPATSAFPSSEEISLQVLNYIKHLEETNSSLKQELSQRQYFDRTALVKKLEHQETIIKQQQDYIQELEKLVMDRESANYAQLNLVATNQTQSKEVRISNIEGPGVNESYANSAYQSQGHANSAYQSQPYHLQDDHLPQVTDFSEANLIDSDEEVQEGKAWVPGHDAGRSNS